ncbi:hypothetical protein J6590_007162 [Homalodisca vitripennis]|nr:hypothetical protein J6590_007162 [Homalodisca vitripennis]
MGAKHSLITTDRPPATVPPVIIAPSADTPYHYSLGPLLLPQRMTHSLSGVKIFFLVIDKKRHFPTSGERRPVTEPLSDCGESMFLARREESHHWLTTHPLSASPHGRAALPAYAALPCFA